MIAINVIDSESYNWNGRIFSPQLDCQDAHVDACLNEQQQSNAKFNFLKKEFRKVFNTTDVVGADIIDECPAFADNEDGLVLYLSGAQKCDFFSYEKRLRGYLACQLDSVQQRDDSLKLLELVPDARLNDAAGDL